MNNITLLRITIGLLIAMLVIVGAIKLYEWADKSTDQEIRRQYERVNYV